MIKISFGLSCFCKYIKNNTAEVKMKALHFDGRKLSLREKPKPLPGAGEVLIRVHYAGICNTDLEILKGYLGFTGTIGHEFVGVVEEAPEANLVGKIVVGEINLACGKCEFCSQGLSRHCPNRTVLGILGKDGAMAEYLTLPVNNVHVVPPGVSELQAVFTEPLAAACEIVEQLEILSDYRVLVIGDGKLGQLVARVLALYNNHLLVVGKHPAKLALLEKLGIATVTLQKFGERRQQFDLVVEATGSWNGWEMALTAVKPRGLVVLKSTYVGEKPFNPAPLVINEITVVGSRCGPFSPALHLLRKQRVDPRDLITEIFPLRRWEAAFARAQEPDSLKILLQMDF